MDKTDGVYITGVRANSAAAKAGLKKGDFITQINGIAVNNSSDMQGQIARFRPGDHINVSYSRNGKVSVVNLQLTNSNGTTDIMKTSTPAKLMGATFRQLSDDEKGKYNIDKGIVVTEPGTGSFAKQTQIIKGFVITGVNNTAVGTVADFQQLIVNARNVQISGFYPGQQGVYYYTLSNNE